MRLLEKCLLLGSQLCSLTYYLNHSAKLVTSEVQYRSVHVAFKQGIAGE
jgi:hypothetical protein